MFYSTVQRPLMGGLLLIDAVSCQLWTVNETNTQILTAVNVKALT